MPVHGLWELLRSHGLIEEVADAGDVRELLEDKSVAVDLSMWDVEAVKKSVTVESIWPNFFVLLSFWRATQLMRIGCSPAGVADGPEAPSLKCHQRQRHGPLSRQLQLIVDVFRAVGCRW
jgi:hypothetical protein